MHAGTSGHLAGPAVCAPGAFPWAGVDPAIAADRGPMAVFSSTFQPHTAIITAATSLYDDSFALPLQSASKPVHLQSRHRRFGVATLHLFDWGSTFELSGAAQGLPARAAGGAGSASTVRLRVISGL